MSGAPLSAAVVGAGPAGLFTLDALLRHEPDARIDVFERLPTPFGLVRSGVAPDHQGTKAVVRQFERAFARPAVRLLANVEVGRDVALDELIAAYDLVFIATGARHERRLGIPGEDLTGVHGAMAFTSWLNGHPDHQDLAPDIGGRVVIIGAGNVAIDVARLLAKSADELRASDLCAHAWPIVGRARRIDIVGRADMAQAKFDIGELEALSRLELACPVIDPQVLAGWLAASPDHPLGRVFETMAVAPNDKPVKIGFHFGLTPEVILGERHVRAVRFADCAGVAREFAADTVITAIGAEAPPRPWPRQVHVVGWAAGTAGTIPTSRREAAEVVAGALSSRMRPDRARTGAWTPASLIMPVVDWAGWKRIEATEVERAEPPRPREKLTRRADLMAAADAIGIGQY